MTEEPNDIETPLAPEAETVCSEEEFVAILAREIPPLVHIDGLVRSNERARLSRRLLATVAEEAAELEDLLTDYDAPYNRTFSHLYELVSALQSFSAVGYTVKSLEHRTSRLGFPGDEELDGEFALETKRTLDFVEGGVRSLLAAIGQQSRRHCGPALAGGAPSHIMQERLGEKKLPHTVGADDVHDVKARIATEASLYLAALKTLRERSSGERFSDVAAMRRYVLDVCDEEQARFFEAKLANIQSRYDTFVVNSLTERRDTRLRRFRQIVGTARDLIRIITLLVHYYERHEDDLRSKEARDRIATMLDKEQILDRILNYALYFAQRILDAGEPLAQTLLDDYTVSRCVTLTLPEGVVLHARPSSLIVKIVVHHGTPVEMQLGDQRCYAGSITQVIMAAGAQHGLREVTFTGDVKPITDIETLFAHRLGEDGMGSLPDELAYLRD
ncbi:MAG: HPr family phosphocarrier protein [Planctomycetota bacterium]